MLSPDAGHFLSHYRSEEHTSELQSQSNLVCRLLLEKNTNNPHRNVTSRRKRAAAHVSVAGVRPPGEWRACAWPARALRQGALGSLAEKVFERYGDHRDLHSSLHDALPI